MKTTPLSPLLALLCFAIQPAFHAAAAPAPDPELERLRAENVELRKEVADLKAKLAVLTPPPPAAEKKDAPKPFTNMIDILANVPADIRPQAKPEWYKFTQDKFAKWVNDQFVGMNFDVTLQFPGQKTMRNIVPQPGAEWILTAGAFDPKPFTFFGASHDWRVRYPTLYLDEAAARKWDNFQAGTQMKVKGTIKSVTLKRKNVPTTTLPEYTFYFELSDLEIIPPK